MKSRRRTTIVATICLLVSMVASILVLNRADQARPHAALDDVLYINSPKVLKHASLGYRSQRSHRL